jgi:hypothetical protein
MLVNEHKCKMRGWLSFCLQTATQTWVLAGMKLYETAVEERACLAGRIRHIRVPIAKLFGARHK